MTRFLKPLVVFLTLGYLGICAFLYVAQDSMLYYPSSNVTNADAAVFILSSEGLSIKVWRAGTGENALLYFGGNGENVANNIPRFAPLYESSTVYFMNYRGFGGSDGEPDEHGFYRDAAALYDLVSSNHANVSIIGRSLGSGVATWLAAERPVDKLVLVTPFDSVESVASRNYPFVPVSLLLRDKYRSIDRVQQISAPVLILVADHDVVVPHAHTMALASQFPPTQLRLRTIDNSDHRSISRSPSYVAAIEEFLTPAQEGSAQSQLSAP